VVSYDRINRPREESEPEGVMKLLNVDGTRERNWSFEESEEVGNA
jgi:hypothetical protein